MGAWSDDDKIYEGKIKLTDVAKIFYTGNTELHQDNLTLGSFTEILKQTFHYIMPDLFHYKHLLTVIRMKDEDRQTLSDSVRTLAKKTLIIAMQDAYNTDGEKRQTCSNI